MNSLLPFLNLDDEQKGCLNRFPKKDGFKMERTDLRDREMLTAAIQPSSFPLHCTLANLLLKCPFSEAFVGWAFSKHKLFHSKLRASLSDGKFYYQLFIRYNFAKVFKIAGNFELSTTS